MKILFLALLMLTLVAHAQDSRLSRDSLMPGGPLQGQPLDTSKIRNLVIIDGKNISIPNMKADYVYIANVGHNNKFYVARIQISSLQKVSFIYEKFTDMAGGHADLVYEVDPKKPIELIYEIKDAHNSKGYRLSRLRNPIVLGEILLTAEVVRAVGDKTKLKEGGLNHSFAMAYRMVSVPERLIEPVLVEGRRTTAVEIPFDRDQVKRSFIDTVAYQNRIGISENYDLLSNNCITAAIRGLSNGLTPKQKAKVNQELSRVFERLSLMSTNSLTETEIKRLFQEYIHVLNKEGVRLESIHEKDYFNKWLNEIQRKRAQSLLCNQLFL